MSSLPISPGRPSKGDRATEAMMAVRNDLRSLQEATASRFVGKDHEEEEHTSVSAGLLSKAERMTKIDMQESYQALFRSLEGKLGRFVELINHLEHDVKDGQRDGAKAVVGLKSTLEKMEVRFQESMAVVGRVSGKLSTLEDRLDNTETACDGNTATVSHLRKDSEIMHGRLRSDLGNVEQRVAELLQRMGTEEGIVKGLVVRVEKLEKKCERITVLEEKVAALEKYNNDFMELSKKSSGSFESEIDQKLTALDSRYASLLKHYHSTIMGQVGSIQESMQAKHRSLQSTTEAELTKLSDELSTLTTTHKTSQEKLSSEIKTLNRRLLSSLRLMKDSAFDPTPASAFTTPMPAMRHHGNDRGSIQQQPQQQHSSTSSVTSEIDHFLRGLEQMAM